MLCKLNFFFFNKKYDFPLKCEIEKYICCLSEQQSFRFRVLVEVIKVLHILYWDFEKVLSIQLRLLAMETKEIIIIQNYILNSQNYIFTVGPKDWHEKQVIHITLLTLDAFLQSDLDVEWLISWPCYDKSSFISIDHFFSSNSEFCSFSIWKGPTVLWVLLKNNYKSINTI